MIESMLRQLARQAQQHSYSPYSTFKVGAAVETSDGYLWAGTNIENASYGLTICAERVAVFNAVMAKRLRVVRVAIVTDADTVTAPCGACRQVLWEFGDAATEVISVGKTMSKTWTLGQLLPEAFGPGDLLPPENLSLGGTNELPSAV